MWRLSQTLQNTQLMPTLLFEMTNPDYKIQELFDVDEMKTYYKVLKLSLTGEYFFIKRFDELMAARVCVRMMRKYSKPIYHYVED